MSRIIGNYPSDWASRRKQVYRRDNYTCQNCGAKGGPKGGVELHAHHVVPVSKGGSHKVSNLTTVCKECHDAIHGNHQAPTSSFRRESTSLLSTYDGDAWPDGLGGQVAELIAKTVAVGAVIWFLLLLPTAAFVSESQLRNIGPYLLVPSTAISLVLSLILLYDYRNRNN